MKKNGGFTLVEILMTVVIFLVLLVVTFPAVVNSLKQREIVTSTNLFLDAVEFARVQAASRNRAYQMVVQLNAGAEGTNGTIRLNEGPTSACLNFGAGLADVRVVDFSVETPNIFIIGSTPEDLVLSSLCFKPDGRVLRVDTQMPVASPDAQYEAGEAIYSLQRRTMDGKTDPIIHGIVIPYNGVPRVAYR
ncbi:MAG: prepilin-type N-terminal cleavage/methylation domain-containing protein [Deltaproteobacteria bacterium]|nr:prepilin-type N-terminal cleavage/methylation domain-containing protein [Deltaproteobacteria bacterium]